MKVKLYKTEKENYVLVDTTKGTYDDGYMLGTSRESQYNKLSIKNCQSIERGYDLDELFDEVDESIDYQEFDFSSFKLGFKKALEILSDKKFSEEDMTKAIQIAKSSMGVDNDGEHCYSSISNHEIIQSLKQTEWEVEVEKENVMHDYNGNISLGAKFKLDAEGCLILKLKSE